MSDSPTRPDVERPLDAAVAGSFRVRVVTILLTTLSLMLVYSAGFGQFSVMVQRGVPLMLAMLAIFLLYPLAGRRPARGWYLGVDAALMVATVWSIGYVVVNYAEIAARMGITTRLDVVAATLGLICLLEATRRAAGSALVVLSLVFLLYAFAGPWLPGLLYHDGFDLGRVARMQWTGVTGVFGSILDVMVKVIFVFILLAEFLRVTRAGDYIIEFALSLTGRFHGGPALTAILASMLFGSVSGSPVANVVGTGTFTIPMMRRFGFAPKVAGAVEAASSSGGYLMPPIMGAGAFVMAEFTGIPYLTIALAAAVPALIYFASLFFGVWLYSGRIGVLAMTKTELPRPLNVVRNGLHVFLVLPILMAMLIAGYTASRACFVSLVALLALSALRPHTRLSVSGIFKAFRDGAEKSVGIMAATAAMGIIIGSMDLTGLGTSIGFAVELVAGASIVLALVLVMAASILIGMGVAPVATYVLLVVTLGPVLNAFGLSVMVAHFFVLYFSTYAVITPPVGLAAYAGAGIAGGDPFRTSIEAFKLGLPGFLLPYLFVLHPELLLTAGFGQAALHGLFVLAIVLPINIVNFGYCFGAVTPARRLLVAVGSAGMAAASLSPLLGVAGAAMVVGVVSWQFVARRRGAAVRLAGRVMEDAP